MILHLRCPKCGFEFMAGLPDDINAKDLDDIKTCPCGCLMKDDKEQEVDND